MKRLVFRRLIVVKALFAARDEQLNIIVYWRIDVIVYGEWLFVSVSRRQSSSFRHTILVGNNVIVRRHWHGTFGHANTDAIREW